MKKQELINKSDTEKKGQLLQRRSTQTGTELGDIKLNDDFQQLNAESSPESLVSILTAPEFLHPANASQKVNMISQLQQTFGNRYIQRVIQAKLNISQPWDNYEQEADRVADEVMRMPEPQVQGQQEDRKERKQEKILQPKGGSDQTAEVIATLESRINALKGDGQPLPKSVRAFFEARFGHDFSRVRIHTDAKGARLAHALNAHAFTIGHDIVFGTGQYSSGTTVGKLLLAHELTHTMQSNPAVIYRKPADAGQPLGGSVKPVYEESVGEEVLHVVHKASEVLHLGAEAAELVGTLTSSLYFLESFGALLAMESIIAVTGILNIVLFVIELGKAMETDIRLARAQATSYAIVAIANGLEPPEPWDLAPRPREVWIKTTRGIKVSFEAIINMGGKGNRFGDMMAGRLLGYLVAIRKEDRKTAVNAIYQAMVQNEARFIRDITLPWPHH